MNKILIFGGTTEGHRLWDFFADYNEVLTDICVATEYGEEILNKHENGKIITGKKNSAEISQLINSSGYVLVIDATHPYAVEVSKNIKNACEDTSTQYLRMARNVDCLNLTQYQNIDEAINYLKTTTGNILVTTGSKELYKFCGDADFLSRLYVRILPDSGAIKSCKEMGVFPNHIIAMQDPFSQELNCAMLKQINAEFLVTKIGGQVGGFLEKVQAAQQTGAKLIVIGINNEEKGYTEGEIITTVCNKLDIDIKRNVCLVGVGMGKAALTLDALEALKQADAVIGAPRLLESLSFNAYSKPIVKADEIFEFLKQNTQYKNTVIALSGDVGFYSGAAKLYTLLKDYNIKTIPGVSSISYFFAMLKQPWQDVAIHSIHGTNISGAGYVLKNKKTFFLLGKPTDAATLCSELCRMGIGNTNIYIGERLSYSDEKIISGTAEDFCNASFDPLSVLLAVNENPIKNVNSGIADTAFIRGKTPMTKREVRAITLSYLDIEQDDIVYDIGAGTGSVAVECAYRAPLGQVYAIDCSDEAIELINKNKAKFGCYNINAIKACAPEGLDTLPIPNKVFIGGSKGNLYEIISVLLIKNPYIKIVINIIALETLSTAISTFKALGVAIIDIVQVSIAKSEKVGQNHMMKGQNPVYIITGQGSGT